MKLHCTVPLVLLLAAALVAAAPSPARGEEEGFVPLFDGWNEYVIEAIGPSLKTWVNGVPCAKLTDDADAEGFIALQVHSGKQGRIRWRNVRIKEVKQTSR